MVNADPAFAIQFAVSAALMASADLATLCGGTPRVWDDVPADSASRQALFPYLTIGEDTIIGHTNQATDPSEIWVKVEAWSRTRNWGECKQLAGAVRAALDAPIAMIGHQVIAHTFHNAIYRKEGDGLTRRAIITQRYLTGPSVSLIY